MLVGVPKSWLAEERLYKVRTSVYLDLVHHAYYSPETLSESERELFKSIYDREAGIIEERMKNSQKSYLTLLCRKYPKQARLSKWVDQRAAEFNDAIREHREQLIYKSFVKAVEQLYPPNQNFNAIIKKFEASKKEEKHSSLVKYDIPYWSSSKTQHTVYLDHNKLFWKHPSEYVH